MVFVTLVTLSIYVEDSFRFHSITTLIFFYFAFWIEFEPVSISVYKVSCSDWFESWQISFSGVLIDKKYFIEFSSDYRFIVRQKFRVSLE